MVGQLNAWTSGFGNARPDVSMMMCSGGSGRSSSASMAGKKSSATVQQMQPLASSLIASASQASRPQPSISERSMPRSPNSLMMKPRRLPLACSISRRIRLVLPAPRKPVITVAGILRAIGSSLFQNERDAGGDQHDLLARRGDVLVEAAGGIAEAARQRVVGHDAEPDLVGDEHDRAGEPRQAREQGLARGLEIAAGEQQVAEPQGQAVDQDRPVGARVARQRAGELERFLDGRPAGAAPRAMLGDAL